jgi:cystinosin
MSMSQSLSQVFGWTYFLAWSQLLIRSVSFYPQTILNYRLKSVRGLSWDFVAVNMIGFFCYALYNIGFLTNRAREEYYDRFGSEPPIQYNDVMFSIHAVILCTITFVQVLYYGDGTPLRSWSKLLILLVGLGIFLVSFLVYAGIMMLLDALYIMSFVKMAISVFKYVPQVMHNYDRSSTFGWSIENIILDSTGGIFSILQVILDSCIVGNWSAITGNPVKFGLGLTSLVFDAVFLIQHYVLYRHNVELISEGESEVLLLPDDNIEHDLVIENVL